MLTFLGHRGGLSWGAPFIAGVAALGIQRNPDLTPLQIRQQLQATGTQFNNGKMINPKKFVETVAALGSAIPSPAVTLP